MSNRTLKVGIVAAEKSGDNLAANLIGSFRTNNDIQFFGVVGPRMREVGCTPVGDIESLSVMGFKDVIKSFPRLMYFKYMVCKKLLKHDIDLFIGVDAPSFNLPLASKLKSKKSTLQVVQYVAPQLWAWRPNRVTNLKKLIDHLFVLFPFEEEYFSKLSVKSEFVGHPVAEKISAIKKRETRENLLELRELNVALLPGSRREEIRIHAPIFFESIQILKHMIDKKIHINIAASDDDAAKHLKQLAEKYEITPLFYVDNSLDCMSESDFAIVSSGTASLEAFLSLKPMVVAYKTNRLNYYLYKKLINIEHISLPNILTNSNLVPELIQSELTADSIAKELMLWMIDEERVNSFREAGTNFQSILASRDGQKIEHRISLLLNRL